MKKIVLPIILCSALLITGCFKGEQSSDIIVQSGDVNTFDNNNGKTLSTTKDKHSNADWFKWQLSTEDINTLRAMKLVGYYSDYWNVYENDEGKFVIFVNGELVELTSADGIEWKLDEAPEVMRSDSGLLVSFKANDQGNSKGVIVNGQATGETIGTTSMDISSFKRDLKLSLKDEVVLGESGEREIIAYDSTNATLYNLEDVLSLLGESPASVLEGFEYSLDKDNLTLSVTRNAYFSENFEGVSYCCDKPLTLTCELSNNLEVFTDDSSVELVNGLKGGTNQVFLKPLVDSKGVWVTDDFLEKWLGIWFEVSENDSTITDVAFSERDLIVELTEKPFRKE